MREAEMERDGTGGPEGMRRQLLARVGAAGLLIVLLLGGLAVYDHLNRPEPPAPAPKAIAQPPASTTELAREGAALAPSPAENAVADVVLRRDAPPEPEMSAAPVIAPPGQRQADAVGETSGAPRLVLGGEPPAPVRPAPHGAGARAGLPHGETPPQAAAPDRPSPDLGKGYLVQMGVFGTPENAAAQLARLESLGVPARLETRVVVGPFPDKSAARAAQSRLKAAGESPGVILTPRR